MGWMPIYFAVLSGIIVVPSVPLYIIILYSHFKYRHKFPFSSTFFKVSFHLGFFDLLHLLNDWVFGLLHYMGLYQCIVENQHAFAYQFSLLWWYSAMGQKLGILALAIDRFFCLWLGKVNCLNTVKVHVLHL